MVAVDANILQELLENRQKANEVKEAIRFFTGKDESFGVSTLSISHSFYLSEAHGVGPKAVEDLIKLYKIYAVTADDVDWALRHYKGKDFEDGLQIAAAIREKCQAFLTIDQGLAAKYSKYIAIKLI